MRIELDWLMPYRSRRGRFQAQDYFSATLFDLGEVTPSLAGILAPEDERGAKKVGITAQFLERAGTYHARFQNTEHYEQAFALGIAAAEFKRRSELDILDIGTGSGVNSVIPCVKIFNNPRIIATDLSPSLLAMLRDYARTAGPNTTIACVCTDAMNDFLRPESFDIVTGVAILHHLLDPTTALRSAYHALRPG